MSGTEPPPFVPPRPQPLGALSRLRLRLLQWVYDLVYVVAVLLASPFLLVMMSVSRKWRSGLSHRLGRVMTRTDPRPAIWIHGVSAGEILATKELVRLLDDEMPWAQVFFSTTTSTGWQAARAAYPDKSVVVYPLDFSFATNRVVRRMRPTVVLLMELELWPNFLLTTSLRDVPVLVANGRMSAKSARDYRILQRFVPEPMTRVLHYCVQSEEYAARFRSLGVPDERLTITGSMKFDTVADRSPGELLRADRERLGLEDGRFVLVAGSTHSGEDEVVVGAFAKIRERDPGARLVIVPRHPERLAEVVAAAEGAGLSAVRLSELGPQWDAARPRGSTVVVGDTVGELARLYAVADLVFVGGTLTQRGGQNMMEPAGLGKPVVVGPNTWHFRDPMELLRSRGGIVEAGGADDVQAALVALHGDPQRRREVGRRARGICLESKGATRRILDILRVYVPPPAGDVRGSRTGKERRHG